MTAKVYQFENEKQTRAEFMTVREVADYLRVSPRTVYAWVEQGKIPFQKKAGSLRFRRSEIEDWDNKAA